MNSAYRKFTNAITYEIDNDALGLWQIIDWSDRFSSDRDEFIKFCLNHALSNGASVVVGDSESNNWVHTGELGNTKTEIIDNLLSHIKEMDYNISVEDYWLYKK